MADNKDKIARYVTGVMDEDEEIAFEAEMANDDELRLHIQLEQIRFANIQRRMEAALESETVKKTKGRKGHFFLKTWMALGLWRWVAAAVLVGLTVWYLLRLKEIEEPISTEKDLPTAAQPKMETAPQTNLKPKQIEPPALPLRDHEKIARKAYNLGRPKAEVSTSGGQNLPTVGADSAAQAFHAYLEKDSAMVFTYYDRHPDDRRAVEWKARYLFEQRRYEEAAVLFTRLKSFRKYEDVGAWNELLCYAAQYQTKKRDFDRLEKVVRSSKYKEELDQLLKQIR